MRVVLLRIGIDSRYGGMQGPLFRDGSFELIPIPDKFQNHGVDQRTYGNTKGRHGKLLIDYFPERRQASMRRQPMHVDPEFETFTYGDPTPPKRGLKKLEKGDLLVFYAGFKAWDFEEQGSPKLYIVGYFEVAAAGIARDFGASKLETLFAENFHVRHREVFDDQEDRLVLVKGGPSSRLLKKACLISSVGRDKQGRPLKILSRKMRREFGDFGGRNSIQRANPRWVKPVFVERAARFARSLR